MWANAQRDGRPAEYSSTPPFGLRTRVGPRNHVLDEGPDSPMQNGTF